MTTTWRAAGQGNRTLTGRVLAFGALGVLQHLTHCLAIFADAAQHLILDLDHVAGVERCYVHYAETVTRVKSSSNAIHSSRSSNQKLDSEAMLFVMLHNALYTLGVTRNRGYRGWLTTVREGYPRAPGRLTRNQTW